MSGDMEFAATADRLRMGRVQKRTSVVNEEVKMVTGSCERRAEMYQPAAILARSDDDDRIDTFADYRGIETVPGFVATFAGMWPVSLAADATQSPNQPVRVSVRFVWNKCYVKVKKWCATIQ